MAKLLPHPINRTIKFQNTQVLSNTQIYTYGSDRDGDKTIGVYITTYDETIRKKYKINTALHINKLEIFALKTGTEIILNNIHKHANI